MQNWEKYECKIGKNICKNWKKYKYKIGININAKLEEI